MNEYINKLIKQKLEENDADSSQNHTVYLYDNNNIRFWCYDAKEDIYILEELEYVEEKNNWIPKIKSTIFLSSEDFEPLINIFKQELFNKKYK